jgi:regulator of sigma E protease
LAFFNILPIPALDGGRLAVLSVERVRGKAFPQERVEQVQGFGMLVLLALIIAVTIKDIIDLL